MSHFCLSDILNFNISKIDEVTFFKLGRWIEYGRVHPRGEKFPMKEAWSW